MKAMGDGTTGLACFFYFAVLDRASILLHTETVNIIIFGTGHLFLNFAKIKALFELGFLY